MKSITTEKSSEEIIKRINSLKPDSHPLWGKMNVSQMLAHVSHGLEIAVGDIKQKRMLMGYLVGGFVKKKVLNDEPFRKNEPTGKSFKISNPDTFENEKQKLIGLIKKASGKGISVYSADPHPFFGKFTPEEYDHLMYKHIDHHLRQFGA